MSLGREIRKVARGWRWGRPAPVAPWAPDPHVPTDAEYDTSWFRTGRGNALRAVLQETMLLPSARFVASPAVRGLERVRALQQPAVIVANHSSHMDTSVIIASLPPAWRHKLAVGAAADYFFRDRLRGHAAAAFMGAFPVERVRASATSARLAVRLVETGWNVILFPEGGRSSDGWLQEMRPGAAFIARRAKRPILPVWISGTEHLWPKGARLPKRGRVRVLFGDALWPRDGEGARELHARMEREIHRLAVEADTDWWTSVTKPHEGPYGPQAASWRRIWARAEAAPTLRSDWR